MKFSTVSTAFVLALVLSIAVVTTAQTPPRNCSALPASPRAGAGAIHDGAAVPPEYLGRHHRQEHLEGADD